MAPETFRSRTGVTVIPVVFAVAAVAYGIYVGYLFVVAGEGDRPPASILSLPDGALIVSEDVSCGSGGCATQLHLMPPAGMTPEELADAIGATPQLRIPGTILDPRTASVMAWPKGTTLVLALGYFSQDYVP
ncbi:hypothetical protein [Microbacterium enclense]|uniref:hypothetical protein n=1 Tax=Microbacterium enclense TaxID=993073 RepID=UPI003D749E7F